MQDVMIDLETLGTSAGCVILSIGAVGFDPETGELGPEFYTIVNTLSCLKSGLLKHRETVTWWDKQSPAARRVIDAAIAGGEELPDALHDLGAFLHTKFGQNVRVWGNGADFDQPILVFAYQNCQMVVPWQFWNSRCFRTLKELYPHVVMPARSGTFHNALDDARTQATHALRIFAERRPVKAILGTPDRLVAPIERDDPYADLIG